LRRDRRLFARSRSVIKCRKRAIGHRSLDAALDRRKERWLLPIRRKRCHAGAKCTAPNSTHVDRAWMSLAYVLWRAFGSTFFIFSDYARPAIRLSALMELPTIFVFTHDAMGDGEDGPTHQPVEQLISLRAIPGLVVLRPADANEVVEAYRYIMQLRHQPAVLALSRQALPTFDRGKYASAAGVAQ